MTPAARVNAAIDLIDQVLAGAPAEKTMTNWARANRYAGSKDRVAIRDYVYDALRCLKSYAAQGGAETGRGIMIGALRAAGVDPMTLFTGQGYGPDPLTEDEQVLPTNEMDALAALDCPEWLAPQLKSALGENFAPVLKVMQKRAPVFMRVNNVLSDVDKAIQALADEDIIAEPHPLSPTALLGVKNPRRIRASGAFMDGFVELQDAGSQAIVDAIPVSEDIKVLDFCAGGGGKSLALAGRGVKKVLAYDLNEARMRDLPKRAERAGADVKILRKDAVLNAQPFDLILADVPCSGSGSWRRSPDEKWRFSAERLDELCAVQAGILDEISDLCAADGTIAYITCSMLESENEDQIKAFLSRHPEWHEATSLRLSPLDGGDGFFLALLKR